MKRDGIALRVGARLVIDADLMLGDALQIVEVTAAALLLQAGRGTVTRVVEQRNVATLPLDGRNFVPLIALSPGVILPLGSILPRITGSRPRTSEYVYDGISVLQPKPGQVAFYPIVGAIEELTAQQRDVDVPRGSGERPTGAAGFAPKVSGIGLKPALPGFVLQSTAPGRP